MTASTLVSPEPLECSHRPDLAAAATSRELESAPRHRWFCFPHSYSYRLVDAILDHWKLPINSVLVDNFAGSGTTLLAARSRGLSAAGFDLSPLAVTVTTAKLASYDESALRSARRRILAAASVDVPAPPGRLSRAFTEPELREISTLMRPIRKLRHATRPFFLVALLATARRFSRAVPDGGWFRWQEGPDRSSEIRDAFESEVSAMMADVEVLNWPSPQCRAAVRRADARKLPVAASCFDGLITSPPYPNRHDYSRVFHIELLLLGEAEPEVTRLRHRTMRSHVEAKPPRGFARLLEAYEPPPSLIRPLESLPATADYRVERFLRGYFEDLYLTLVETERILRPGGKVAYVVGNVRHAGVMFEVDMITADLCRQAGLEFEATWVIRTRGNSAQQMGRHGRHPSRESVVLMSKKATA